MNARALRPPLPQRAGTTVAEGCCTLGKQPDIKVLRSQIGAGSITLERKESVERWKDWNVQDALVRLLVP